MLLEQTTRMRCCVKHPASAIVGSMSSTGFGSHDIIFFQVRCFCGLMLETSAKVLPISVFVSLQSARYRPTASINILQCKYEFEMMAAVAV
jgi:hypothetical protein